MENIDTYLKEFKRSGDNAWFEKIFNLYMPKIFRFLYFRTLDRQAAEDLVSEVFIKVYVNLPHVKLNKATFNAWIYKIAGNTFIDYYRKVKKMKDDIPIDEYNAAIPDTELFIRNSTSLKKEMVFGNPNLLRGLSNLTPLQKDVLFLKFVEDLDYGTIAEITGKRKSTLRGIIFRALSGLKDEIKT
ncbi:MAG: RNA polymerase sigma factor [Actinobacteria bacterium]|nr:RNA polymerase sigma factor [Actinomycetota bacterium]